MREICECCNRNKSVAVASIPGMPISIAWCQRCIDLRVMPYWALVFSVGCMYPNFDELRLDVEHLELIKRTLTHLHKTYDEFEFDVEHCFDDLLDEIAPREDA